MAEGKKEWMLGLPGHNSVLALDDVLLLVKGGQLRPTDLVKKLGSPWRAANEVPELAEYFAAPARSTRPATSVPPPKTEPPKPTTSKVPKAEAPKSPTSVPPPKVAPVRETRVARKPDPESELTEEMESVKPAPETKPTPEQKQAPKAPSDSKPPSLAAAGAAEGKPSSAEAPEGKPERPLRRATRPLPVAPARVEPVLEPMVAKYYSPVDLLRCASYAFEPRKLVLTAAGMIPIAVILLMGRWLGGQGDTAGHRALFLASHAAAVFGLAFVLVALAYVTRRQLEDEEYGLGGILGYLKSQIATALIYPGVVLPSLFSLGLLWLLGLLRNSGTGMATTLRLVYFIPMVFALITVMGAILYQLGSMYIPSAAAIEGARLSGAVNAAWNTVRRQWGRMVLHWLIVTVASGVIGVVTLTLAIQAFWLPELIFPAAEAEIQAAWATRVQGLMPMYMGVALGLGLALPVSLFATLGTLSYMALRHPATQQLSPAPMDETSHDPLPPSGSRPPAEAAKADTRPAPADDPGLTPAPSASDVSEETDEQSVSK